MNVATSRAMPVDMGTGGAMPVDIRPKNEQGMCPVCRLAEHTQHEREYQDSRAIWWLCRCVWCYPTTQKTYIQQTYQKGEADHVY